MAEYAFTLIDTEQNDAVLVARFNRPPRNLMNAKMVEELTALLDQVEADESVRVLVLTGAIQGG